MMMQLREMSVYKKKSHLRAFLLELVALFSLLQSREAVRPHHLVVSELLPLSSGQRTSKAIDLGPGLPLIKSSTFLHNLLLLLGFFPLLDELLLPLLRFFLSLFHLHLGLDEESFDFPGHCFEAFANLSIFKIQIINTLSLLQFS